jgi:GT2 family glycosyltransferase
MEDLDFKRRVVDFGAQTHFVPEAKIVHPWRMLDLKRHTRRHVASQLIYARLHPDEQNLFSFTTHLKNIGRYYLRDFPSEVKEFGWSALRCQPVRWWEMAYRGWHLLTQSNAR